MSSALLFQQRFNLGGGLGDESEEEEDRRTDPRLMVRRLLRPLHPPSFHPPIRPQKADEGFEDEESYLRDKESIHS